MTIVSQETVRKLWGADDPLGRVIRVVGSGREFTVIGVVGDVRLNALGTEPLAAMYFSAATRVWPLMEVAVRTQGRPEDAIAAIRGKVRDLDPELPVASVRTMEDWVANNAAQPRFHSALFAAFAAIALLIAAIGIYGVLSYSVTQRTREIGIRLALGASRTEVLRMVVGEGMRMGIAGICAIGLAGAFALPAAPSRPCSTESSPATRGPSPPSPLPWARSPSPPATSLPDAPPPSSPVIALRDE